MIIGIDAREISKPDTGTGMYVVNLIKSISKIDKINKYILFVNKNSKLDAVLPLNFQYYEIIYFFNSKFEDQIVIPIAIWKSGIEYYHVIHHDVTPFFTNKPLIITVLDIAWIDIPNRSSRLFQKYYYYITKFALKKAKQIITISNSTKERINYHFPFVKSKSTSIPIACDESYTPIKNDIIFNNLVNEFKIEKPYVLYVGSFASRKNLELLINAMIKIWRNDKHIQLVLAGKPSGKDDFSFKNHLTNYPILILDRSKTLEELKNLYINALVFVFPSIYEGFGLPILEAMSCGCPVIGINSTSIPEIIGTAGILVEKDDVDGLAKNIICFTQNNSDSKIISTNCIQQANKFNWNLVAINTIMIYNKMYD